MPVLSRTKKIPALIDGSEYKRESDIPDGGTDSVVDYCQALDWTDIVCIIVRVCIVVSCVYCCHLMCICCTMCVLLFLF